jgi:hypothetical protein
MDADSVLYIEVPHEELMAKNVADRERLKRHWHEHINFYSERSMARLVENCGLAVIKKDILSTHVAGADIQISRLACKLSAE